MKKITKYEIEYLGIENRQYFRGVGTTFTRWTEVQVGIGSDPMEAFEDALDQIAWSSDYDVSGIVWAEAPEEWEEIEYPEDANDDEYDAAELFHYVAIYYGEENE